MTDPVARAADIASLGLRGSLSSDEIALVKHARAGDPDARVRAAALAALVRSSSREIARAEWLEALSDESAAVRRRAAELAPSLTPADEFVVEQHVPVLGDGDVTVVEAAAWALGEVGEVAAAHGAVDDLVVTLRTHRDPIAREAAVAALGALGDSAALPAILAACADRAAVRRRAVLALAPFEGTDVDAAITTALTDNDWQVRQAAEDLQRTGQADESSPGATAPRDSPPGDS